MEQGVSPATAVAINAELYSPTYVALDAGGNLYIADRGNDRVRVLLTNGTISTVASNGAAGSDGDGGSALSAQVIAWGLAASPSGALYISGTGATETIRVLTPSQSGQSPASQFTISTVAGNGNVGFSGDGGPATSAEFNTAIGIAADSGGNLYIADYNNNRVRKVTSGGIITPELCTRSASR